jgi:hypothetical protein
MSAMLGIDLYGFLEDGGGGILWVGFYGKNCGCDINS